MTELRSIVKLLDGPEAGNSIVGYRGEPPDEITVFRTQYAAEGTLVCAPTDNRHGLLEGDLIYKKVSRSALYDTEFAGHPNVMPGCAYVFVRQIHA